MNKAGSGSEGNWSRPFVFAAAGYPNACQLFDYGRVRLWGGWSNRTLTKKEFATIQLRTYTIITYGRLTAGILNNESSMGTFTSALSY